MCDTCDAILRSVEEIHHWALMKGDLALLQRTGTLLNVYGGKTMMVETERRILYIAGPYKAHTTHWIYRNIMEARRRMEWAWLNGWIPICPHTNSAFTDGLVPEDAILKGYLKILGVCDAILMISGWDTSDGASKEWARANELGLEVVSDPFA